VVLRSRCPADAGSKACTKAEPAECKDYTECPPGEDCVAGGCEICKQLDAECKACPAGTQAQKQLSGGCVVCTCVPLCKSHEDCPRNMACVAGGCSECASPITCPTNCDFGWIAQGVLRNGCKLCECAPMSECTSDEDCGPGRLCYPGQICDENCASLDCCRGNLCAAPNCKPTSAISCTLVGCASGTCTGDPACKPGSCKCDVSAGTDSGWVCSPECTASCA
jgi:hypothetical protein